MAASLQLNPAYGLETVPCVAWQKKKKNRNTFKQQKRWTWHQLMVSSSSQWQYVAMSEERLHTM